MGLREQILTADDRRREPVEVPEWGVTVYISELSAADADAYAYQFVSLKNQGENYMANFRSRLLVLCLVDETGARLFDGPEDVDALGEKSTDVIKRLYEQAEKINGMDSDYVEEEKKS